MATTLDPVALSGRSWHLHPSARKIADAAGRRAIKLAGLRSGEIDLLLNTGIYHDRNLGEPALAALIQEDVGINPDDPRPGEHGTFSFDVANGACGVLTALHVADGFLRSRTIEHALVVASDSDPGHHMAPDFPFSAIGAAVACHWDDGPGGLVGFHWERSPDHDNPFCAHVGFERGRNLLRVEQHPAFDSSAAAAAAKCAASLLAEHDLGPAEVDLVVANPLTEAFLGGLAAELDIDAETIVRVEGSEHVHSPALLVALATAGAQQRLEDARTVLLVSAGAGILVGSALLVQNGT